MFGIEDMEMGQETFAGRDITMVHHYDRPTHVAQKLEWSAEHHVLVKLLGNDGVHLGRATDIGINDYIRRVSNVSVWCRVVETCGVNRYFTALTARRRLGRAPTYAAPQEPSAVYCPKESALPKPVRSGFYSIGGDNSTNKTRNAQVICPKGWYCVGE